MFARTDLDRLAAARPDLLDHTERIVDAQEEDRLLSQILCSGPAAAPVASARPGRAGASRGGTPRLAAVAVAGTLALALGVAGVLTATGAFRADSPGSAAGKSSTGGHGGGAAASHVRVISVQTLANQTAAAMDSASRTDIFYSRSVFAAGMTSRSNAIVREWDHGIAVREMFFTAGGSLTDDISAVVSHGMRDRRFVSYTAKTWQSDSIKASHYGPAASVSLTVDRLLAIAEHGQAAAVPGQPSGQVTTVTVNGRRLFKVSIKRSGDHGGLAPLPLFTDSPAFPSVTTSKALTETVFISQSTRLPVRVVLTTSTGRVLGSQTFAWLRPDRANLAELTPAPIPAGFHQTGELAH